MMRCLGSRMQRNCSRYEPLLLVGEIVDGSTSDALVVMLTRLAGTAAWEQALDEDLMQS